MYYIKIIKNSMLIFSLFMVSCRKEYYCECTDQVGNVVYVANLKAINTAKALVICKKKKSNGNGNNDVCSIK